MQSWRPNNDGSIHCVDGGMMISSYGVDDITMTTFLRALVTERRRQLTVFFNGTMMATYTALTYKSCTALWKHDENSLESVTDKMTSNDHDDSWRS